MALEEGAGWRVWKDEGGKPEKGSLAGAPPRASLHRLLRAAEQGKGGIGRALNRGSTHRGPLAYRIKPMFLSISQCARSKQDCLRQNCHTKSNALQGSGARLVYKLSLVFQGHELQCTRALEIRLCLASAGAGGHTATPVVVEQGLSPFGLLTVLEAGKSRIQAPTGSVSAVGLFLIDGAFHMLSQRREGAKGKGQADSRATSIRSLIPVSVS